ncbi:MAG TPA: dihydroorotase [Planctomycetota bacterium]|nr:dihydroorotase [Planctomycetota bacterium]
MILIKNAKPFDVLLDGGKIKKTGKISEKADETIDARGLIVVPGLIDMHVHFREPGREDKETIATGAAAAIAGGFTSVAVMANSGRVCDDAVGVVYVQAKSREANGAHVYAVGAVTKGLKGEELAELGKMSEAGAVAFSDDGMPILNSELMRRALEYSKMFGKPILSHCEDATLTKGFVMNEGPVSAKLGLRGYPNAAEAIMAARDCALAALTGGRVHLCHVSAKETVEVVRQAKKQGLQVTAEAAPHHLMLTDESLADYESKYKMNPPLRTKEDVEAVVQGVADGTIDVIASDHAPHTAEEKEQELAACPNGVVGLETSLGVVLSIRKIPFARAIDAMTVQPARILGLRGKGTLAAGADADLTLIDPKARWTVDPGTFRSKGRNTPYDKMTLTGRAAHVIVGGRVCF